MPYTNPVIPGFHPDPSVCRVGEDYYLVTSTFEYFPGIPIFHSRDLVNWRQIGHCLTTPQQLPLPHAGSSAGLYAPTIRYHQGVFYMTTTNLTQGGNFIVTATDPAGPWSNPIYVDQRGIDPSLYFDDDGTVYYATGCGRILQSTIDLATGAFITEPRCIWEGSGGRHPEGPHLYKINGAYYLMIAEGGTEYGHMETIARSDSPWGPFTPCPHNPILSNRDCGGELIQGTGHADLVQAHDGSWWLVFLAFRAIGYRSKPTHHLGRETCLAPVTWDADGWPVVNGTGTVTTEMAVPTLPLHPWEPELARDNFDTASLRPTWNFLRNPVAEDWSLMARPGWLRLRGSAVTLNECDSPAFVGRRQQHFSCTATTLLEFSPTREGEEAGLTVLMNEEHHYEIGVTLRDGVRRVFVRRRIGDLTAVTAEQAIPDGPVVLQISADEATYTFACGTDTTALAPLATGMCRYLSSEVAGGFTGVYFGLYATGNGQPSAAPADFAWFDYVGE